MIRIRSPSMGKRSVQEMRNAATAGLNAEMQEKLLRQLNAWRENLLSIDRRQKLVYFKHPRSGSFEIISPSVRVVEQLLRGNGARLVSALPDSSEGESAQELGLPTVRKPHELVVEGKTGATISATCRRLLQASSQQFADRGVWTLFVGLGMLNWTDPADGKAISSPLLLLPVKLVRVGQDFELLATEDEPSFNSALALKLGRDFGIEFDEISDDDHLAGSVAAMVRSAIFAHPDWSVDERVVLAMFSFHKEAMYRDLENNESAIMDHALVQLLALGGEAPNAESFAYEPPTDTNLDKAQLPESMHTILDADGSQRKCIIAARDGKSFVMDGPPGTGKSQTIANIIAELMAQGKSVLFVSEKAAALDVVHERLANRGLGPFLLELHSHKATRKEVVRALDDELGRQPVFQGGFSGAERRQLTQTRRDLTRFAKAMNEIRPALGLSLQSALGQLLRLSEFEKYSGGDVAHLSTLTADLLGKIRSRAEALGNAWEPTESAEEFVWRGLTGKRYTMSEKNRVERELQELEKANSLVISHLRSFDSMLPFLALPRDVAGLQRRAEISSALNSRFEIPTSWWGAIDTLRIEGRLGEIESVLGRRQELVALAIERFSTSWESSDDQHRGSLSTIADGHGRHFLKSLGELTLRQVDEVSSRLSMSVVALNALLRTAEPIARVFDVRMSEITFADVQALIGIARLSQSPDLPEPEWINPSVQKGLHESVRVLEPLVALLADRSQTLSSTFTKEALDTDLVGLNVRFKTQHKGYRRWSKQAKEDRKTLKSISVARSAGKTTVARLDDAVLWQQAHLALRAREHDFSPRLASYYRGTATEFDRIKRALAVAQEAIDLAGGDISLVAVARQLSNKAAPESNLLPDTGRLADACTVFNARTVELFAEGSRSQFLTMPLFSVKPILAELVDHIQDSLPARQRGAALGCSDVTVSDTAQGFANIAEINKIDIAVRMAEDDDSTLFGHWSAGLKTDIGHVRGALVWAVSIKSLLGRSLAPSEISAIQKFTAEGLNWRHALSVRDQIFTALTLRFDDDRRLELRQHLEADPSKAEHVCSELSLLASSKIDIWFEYKRHRKWLESRGFAATIGDLEQTTAHKSHVAPAIERAALEAWVETVIDEDPVLGNYRSENRDSLVGKFRALDSKLIECANQAVIKACAERRPRSNIGGAALITREAQKKSRHLPVRDLLTKAGATAQALKPCFMMSPLSVSQFLPPGLRFDVVIFDEASQVLPSDGVNCIYRGSQLIVAGDQKQLPPTAFFASSEIDDDADEDALDSFDSLLDLCKAAGALPSMPLTWHYRSQHEDLITYSNYRFYGGTLNTFPGARERSKDLGVHHEYVPDGVYRRGGDRKNIIEAERVVDRVLEVRRLNSGLTLGVVTFSTAQADAVSEAIERRAQSEPLLMGLMDDHDRLSGFFVKNLESVQGDERDVIIFSVGYGPDENRKLSMNFGPLKNKGGERRLNVAITRARRRVEVVSSFLPEQMTETASEGNRHLKQYLDFAIRGMKALAAEMRDSLGDVESPFEEEVVKAIRSWGYDAVPQVGSAGYRVDIGVRHPDKPGVFMLGIECDGAAYHSSKIARDRDRLRENVLRGLGWTIHRIWGISWYRDRSIQESRLKEALEGAIEAGTSDVGLSPKLVISPANVIRFDKVELSDRPEWVEDYSVAPTPTPAPRADPSSPTFRRHLQKYCAAIIEVEAPLHVEVLHERFRRDWGIKLTADIKRRIVAAIEEMWIDGNLVVLSTDDVIRLPGAEEIRVRGIYTGMEARKWLQVPREEIEQAVLLTVRDTGFTPEHSLNEATRLALGWKSATADRTRVIKSAILWLIDSGVIAPDELTREIGLGSAILPVARAAGAFGERTARGSTTALLLGDRPIVHTRTNVNFSKITAHEQYSQGSFPWTKTQESRVLELYKEQQKIREIADETRIDQREVAILLIERLLGSEGNIEDVKNASRNGMNYSRAEIEELDQLVKDDSLLPDIAKRMNRTQLGIGWRMLDHYDFPIPD